ncbi:Transglutaminase-like enzyme, putative cysteine protease [Neorhodopirellula lusitana]|uniref:Transglutaminase-like enzyme, putative cysteine protease n=1 Tax=Neorhodopirellula lusitana TaxID=445327 RepID=A0ABY1PMT4_9BACT|nr:DUF3488 and transglutaminase-like domain-containing protein [Neorhodopirellula lusitana]SMP37973.1 Transglutaminase-like enzyme, putative cysteine protease [Neorhodopirellula lusitana]
MSEVHPNVVHVGQKPPSWAVPDSSLRLRTKFAFALITALGGMVVGTGSNTQALSVIVVGFAIIGFVLVDWLKFFALPSVIAYAAMGLTALVCVADFIQGAELLSRKMVSVAELLAVAQAILMLQEKTSRLFEQLLVFALLNCIVAAVFNDAFNYAIWFLPLTFAAGLALALLAADQSVEATQGDGGQARVNLSKGKTEDRSDDGHFFLWDNSVALKSLGTVALRLPWVTIFLTMPAIAAFAIAFFFLLPRRIEPKRGVSGEALVGFSDHVRLGQIGKMQMTQERALRVRFEDPEADKPYPVVDGIYLRGLTMEDYLADRSVRDGGGSWSTTSDAKLYPSSPLPVRFVPDRRSDFNFFDRVNVEVSAESLRTPALFAVAPFHRISASDEIDYRPAQWIIGRSQFQTPSSGRWYDPIEYRFGTHAFRDGVQTPWLAHRMDGVDEFGGGKQSATDTSAELDYLDRVLEFPLQSMPSVQLISDQLVSEIPKSKRSPIYIARQLEQHLSMNRRFRYSLEGDVKPVAGVDPIEQFLTTDPRGHCQYFASTLAMMLRSQGIPARLVVGYHCNEFSDLGQYFIVRQSHAHAWVEALIERDDIPSRENIYGQPESESYWLRLDPTPGGGAAQPEDNGIRQFADLAQNLWTDYVVEMDSDRQRKTLLAAPSLGPMTQTYRSWIDSVKAYALRINAGEVQGIAGTRMFSLPAALTAIAMCVVLAVLLKWNITGWIRGRWIGLQQAQAAKPSVPFYAETLELLEQLGYERQVGQTPAELSATLKKPQLQDPVRQLTEWFYQIRYGQASQSSRSRDAGGNTSANHAASEQDSTSHGVNQGHADDAKAVGDPSLVHNRKLVDSGQVQQLLAVLREQVSSRVGKRDRKKASKR